VKFTPLVTEYAVFAHHAVSNTAEGGPTPAALRTSRIRHHGEHFCTSGRRSHGAGPCAPTRPPTKAATPNVLMLSRLIPIGSTPENPTPVEAMAWRLRTPEGKQLYGPRPVRHTLRTARAAAPALLETAPVLIHPRHLQWRPSSASAVPRSSTPGVTSTCAATAIISR
jgi:hypothetical protein